MFAMLGLGDIVRWFRNTPTLLHTGLHLNMQYEPPPLVYFNCQYIFTQVLPGLLLCFAMRFDNEIHASLSGGAVGGARSRLALCCRQWSYFIVALIGYASGLLMASFVADWYGAAQPALLYLVPGVLAPLIVKALLQVSERVCVCVCVCACSYVYVWLATPS